MAVTIKQIAEMCNVSRGTVDRVLNHRGRVSEETIQKVNDAVEKLGYKPNTFGKALALQKKKLRIGIILCSDGNEFYDDVIEGLKAAEEEHRDYQIEIVYRYMKGYDVREQLDLLDELKINVQCIILTAIDDIQIARKIDECMEKGIGVFTLNTDISDSKRILHIGVDVLECGRIACGLIALLCGEVGNVLIATGSLSLLESRNRIFGFCSTMEKRYPGIKLTEIIETQDNHEEAYKKMKGFLERNKNIQAVFIAGGGVTGICTALKEYEMGHVKVVACDTIPAVRRMMEEKWIQATIVQQPWRQGYQVLDVAIRYLVGDEITGNIEIENEIKLYENL